MPVTLLPYLNNDQEVQGFFHFILLISNCTLMQYGENNMKLRKAANLYWNHRIKDLFC